VELFVSVMVLAFLVERIAGLLYAALPGAVSKGYKQLGALFLGVVIAFGAGVDLIAAVLPDTAMQNALLTQFLTGLLLGGGSSFLHDTWGALAAIKAEGKKRA
jgi:hypothetical protein